MIITKTPFRVSLFGGSTDYPSFYKEFGSLLIGFSIDKYCYLSLRRTPKIFPYRTLLNYSTTEMVNSNSNIKHNGVRGVLEYLGIRYGIELSHTSDLPAQTGTGSSSSFVVGLLNAFHTLRGKPPSKRELSEQAIFVERDLLKEPGGVQDQIWAAYGGFNSIEISRGGDFETKPMPLSPEFKESFLKRCVLLYTGKTRKSFKIASSHDTKKAIKHKRAILNIAKSAYNSFAKQDICEIGEILDESWQRKREISPLVSNTEIDDLYNKCIGAGALGGKLLGSGGSGFLFFILKENSDKKRTIKETGLTNIEFKFDEKGSVILNK